jgi:hypothetical protein
MEVAHLAALADREPQVQQGVTPVAELQQAHRAVLQTVWQAPQSLRTPAARYLALRQGALRQLRVRAL